MMEIAFWVFFGIIFYTYIGYALVIFVLARITTKKVFDYQNNLPAVTLVIPAYNEENFITEKVRNCLGLEYPNNKIRILFITDGSTDRTYAILNDIRGVEVVHQERRAGKAAAENRAMGFIDTPIVIFCDANTRLNKRAVKELVKHYQDPAVGAVAGEKKVISPDLDDASGSGEGLYWRYESALKRWDSDFNTVVGAAGELISFRTELVQELEEDTILDDFVQSLRICEKGYKVKYEPLAVASETASANVKEELKRKIRIAAGGWQAMIRLRSLLIPFRQPRLWFQYVSHRVLRWSITPVSLPVLFVLNIVLVFNQPATILFHIFFWLQVAFYLLALCGWLLKSKKIRIKGFFAPYYFCMMNYAVYAGLIKFMRGRQAATWDKSRRLADSLRQ